MRRGAGYRTIIYKAPDRRQRTRLGGATCAIGNADEFRRIGVQRRGRACELRIHFIGFGWKILEGEAQIAALGRIKRAGGHSAGS